MTFSASRGKQEAGAVWLNACPRWDTKQHRLVVAVQTRVVDWDQVLSGSSGLIADVRAALAVTSILLC